MNKLENIFSPRWYALVMLPLVLLAGCGDDNASVSPATMSSAVPSENTGAGGAGKGPPPVDLGAAGGYVILAKSAIANRGISEVSGNIGLNPAAAIHITGFAPAISSPVPDNSAKVHGKILAADQTVSNAAELNRAISDMRSAYADAAGRVPDYFELGAGIIGGMRLVPATYKWSTAVLIPTSITLNGGPNDVWIFQVVQGVIQAPAARVILTGGALPKNVFWQVSGAVDIGKGAHMEGNILSQDSITLGAGASANSRLLSQTAVNLDGSVVVQPVP